MGSGFKGKKVIITGGSEGIGYCTARAFLEQGAQVTICGRSENKLSKAVNELCKNGIARACIRTEVCDVGKWNQFRNFLISASERMGGLDILVNNAGFMASGKLEQVSEELWDKAIEVNLKSVLNGIQCASKLMKDKGGVIVNASSYAAVMPSIGSGVYAAAKAGVISLTRTAAAELSPYGIRVVGYIPGLIDTALNAENIANNEAELKDSIALHRFGRPEDVAKAVLFLASDDAAYITGSCLEISGGKYAVQNAQKVWN